MEKKEKSPAAGTVIEKEGGSALNISLHPLVIINISDHATRGRMSSGGKTQPRVIGALFGVQSGRSVEIFNSFEIVYTEVAGAVVIDTEYVKTKQEQCAWRFDVLNFLHFVNLHPVSQVFKNYDLLGWYSTGSECKPKDIEIHNQVGTAKPLQNCELTKIYQFIAFNESPLYLLLDPVASKINTRGLPLTLYESELRIINDEPTMLFSKVQYKIETGEAERIAVDHVAHVTPTGGEAGSQRKYPTKGCLSLLLLP